jgi:hypothetical protein
MEPGGEPSQAEGSAATLCEAPPKRLWLHVVRERLPPGDLDDRDQLAVPRLELGIAGDVDLVEREPKLVAKLDERRSRALAQVAAAGVVEDDLTRSDAVHTTPEGEMRSATGAGLCPMPFGIGIGLRRRRRGLTGEPRVSPCYYGYRPLVVVASATRCTARP